MKFMIKAVAGAGLLALAACGGNADDQAAEVSRLHSLGAIDIDLGQGDSAWKCLADPEGNDFCVLAAG